MHLFRSCGWRRALIGLMAFPALAGPCLAGYHQRGNFTLSLGGSFAHTEYRGRAQNFEAEVTGEFSDTQSVSPPDNYTDYDISIYLSSGYFFTDHIELGVSGSTIWTLYPEENQSDLEIYDFTGYAKYYFDSKSRWTPYVEIEGGSSFLETGDYSETAAIGGASLGLEFLGLGSFTWYVEFNTEYRDNGGDLTGSEWQNEIYFGVTLYPNLLKKKAGAAVMLPAGEAMPAEEQLDPATGLHPAQVEALKKMGVDISTLRPPGAAPQETPVSPGVPVTPVAPSPSPAPEVPGPSVSPAAPEAPAIEKAAPPQPQPEATVPRTSTTPAVPFRDLRAAPRKP